MRGNWSGVAQDRIWLVSIQILIENDSELVWDRPGQNLIVFYLNFNWKQLEIGLEQPNTESDWFVFKFELKMKGNRSGTAEARIWLISIQISIENGRILV